MNKRLRLPLAIALTLAAAIIIAVFLLAQKLHSNTNSSQTSRTTSQNNATQSTDQPAGFDKSQFSLTDPTSMWVIVNKKRPLKPQNYVPDDLVTPNLPLRVPGNESMQMRRQTSQALETLFAAAKADNTPLMVSSGYRSYTYQVSLYGKYVSDQGQATADTQSARPGYSEHQTGLAVDVEPLDQKCDVEVCFADTSAGKWIAADAYKYGFVIRYPEGKTAITGYEYEPWHIRYVGIDLATEMHNKHIATLEEFFGLPAAPDY
jgi:D-alanyl-D-alanine carboxypeptidase